MLTSALKELNTSKQAYLILFTFGEISNTFGVSQATPSLTGMLGIRNDDWFMIPSLGTYTTGN